MVRKFALDQIVYHSIFKKIYTITGQSRCFKVKGDCRQCDKCDGSYHVVQLGNDNFDIVCGLFLSPYIEEDNDATTL